MTVPAVGGCYWLNMISKKCSVTLKESSMSHESKPRVSQLAAGKWRGHHQRKFKYSRLLFSETQPPRPRQRYHPFLCSVKNQQVHFTPASHTDRDNKRATVGVASKFESICMQRFQSQSMDSPKKNSFIWRSYSCSDQNIRVSYWFLTLNWLQNLPETWTISAGILI